MRIGELAKRAGVSVQAVRFYERRGLIDQPKRTASGYRDYEPQMVPLLLSIKRAQELGFTLQEIKLMRELHTDSMSRERAYAFAAEKLLILDRKITALEALKHELTLSLRRAEAVRACPAAIPSVPPGDQSKGRKRS